MKKLTILLGVLLFSLSSCLNSDDPEYTVEATYYGQNHVVNTTNDEITFSKSEYKFKLDLANANASITMTGRFANEQDAVTLTIDNLPITTNSQEYSTEINSEAFSPSVDGHESDYLITDFKCSIWQLTSNDNGITQSQNLYRISFLVNGKYRVTVIDRQPNFINCTTNTVGGTTGSFQSKTTTYSVAISDKSDGGKQATLYVYNSKFADKMPSMNMVFKDLPVTLDANGYTINANAVTPYINDVPYPDYKITSLTASVSNKGMEFSLRFNCSVPKLGDYLVNALGKRLPEISNGNNGTGMGN